MSGASCVASVKVQGVDHPIDIPVSSPGKPEISYKVKMRWQEIIDAVALCFNLPAGLIMQLHEKSIEVFISSRTKGNPYSPGDSEHLNMGLYCETVVGTGESLVVPDARKHELWNRNPDIKLGMVSYLGFPLYWPDGEVFGTLCVLDSKENPYSESYISLMEIMKQGIEKDLEEQMSNFYERRQSHKSLEATILALNNVNRKLENSLHEKDLLLSEVHHRVKNNLQIILSLIDLQAMSVMDAALLKEFRSIKTRIQSMGIVHNILYKSGDFERVSVKEYIELLVENLEITFCDFEKKYEYEINIDENLSVNIDTAVTLGLIANEIITNSIKHAFSSSDSGKIHIEILQLNEGTFCMKLGDNGCGFRKKKSKGLGTELIGVLVEQLNGFYEIKSEGGTSYTIVFDRVEKEDDRWLKKFS